MRTRPARRKRLSAVGNTVVGPAFTEQSSRLASAYAPQPLFSCFDRSRQEHAECARSDPIVERRWQPLDLAVEGNEQASRPRHDLGAADRYLVEVVDSVGD